MTKGVKDSSGLYEVERRAYHAARPGFRIAELQISPTQKCLGIITTMSTTRSMSWREQSESFSSSRRKRCVCRGARLFPSPRSARTSSLMQVTRPRYFSCCRESASTISCHSLEALGRSAVQQSGFCGWDVPNRSLYRVIGGQHMLNASSSHFDRYC